MLGRYVNANSSGATAISSISFRYEVLRNSATTTNTLRSGALGLGWNLHKERFMRGHRGLPCSNCAPASAMSAMPDSAPNQAQLAYQYSSDLLYNGSIGAVPVSMVNPRLKWERSLKRNFGVDFGFWNDHLNGSAISITTRPTIW